jgi:predicted HicB family RNase H-like nuclease
MRKTETLNLRVSAQFKRRLMEEAKKEKRSVTNYLEATLTSLWKVKASPRKAAREIKEQSPNT